MTAKELVNTVVTVLDEKKAKDIQVIETRDVTIIADFFVLCSATSNTHVKSLCDDLEFALEQTGLRPHHVEGKATGWILLDYGHVLVHVFQQEQREYYNLERLWADAKTMDISALVQPD